MKMLIGMSVFLLKTARSGLFKQGENSENNTVKKAVSNVVQSIERVRRKVLTLWIFSIIILNRHNIL